MAMRVFIAGATGAVGRPLVAQLIQAGHIVIGLARDERAAQALRDQGATAELADAMDVQAVRDAVARSRPDVVINQLTSLPKRYTPETMRAALETDHRLRGEGGANLQAAAAAVGAKRYILQSCAFWYEEGAGLADESASLAVNATPYIAEGSRFYQKLEQAANALSGPKVVLLRYGYLYGPGTWYASDGDAAEQVRQQQSPIIGEGRGVWSWVHVEDAAAAAVLALDRGQAGAYNIVDDDPSPVRTWLPAFANWLGAPAPPHRSAEQAGSDDVVYYATKSRGASNAKAKRELGFQPRRLEWLNPPL
jgi:nucleoside-diphosphate-sugar epimerase